MGFELQTLSEQTDPAIVNQALSLINGQILQDGQRSPSELADITGVSGDDLQAMALVGDDGQVLSVMSVDNSRGTKPSKKDIHEVVFLAVRPEHQHQGIGRYMMRQVERHVAANGGGAVWASPTSEAYGFYTNAGYTQSSSNKDYMIKQVEAEASPPSPRPPAIRSPREVLSGGSYGERVVLGAATASHAAGNLLMTQSFTVEVRMVLQAVLDGSDNPLVEEILHELGDADQQMKHAYNLLHEGSRMLSEYTAQIAKK